MSAREITQCVQESPNVWRAGLWRVTQHRDGVWIETGRGTVSPRGFEAEIGVEAIGALAAALRCAEVAALNWRAAHPPDPAMDHPEAI